MRDPQSAELSLGISPDTQRGSGIALSPAFDGIWISHQRAGHHVESGREKGLDKGGGPLKPVDAQTVC